MFKLTHSKRSKIIQLLCEGMSIRATSRVTGASKNTIAKLLSDVGRACAVYHALHVRNLKSRKVQMDESWSFVYAKQDHVRGAKAAPPNAGDAWTWTAIEADSKLLISWLVGSRSTQSALRFVRDVKSRLSNRIQLTSDGHRPYLEAVESVFGNDVDFTMLHKIYGPDPTGEKRHSPAACIGAQKRKIVGNPKVKDISTVRGGCLVV